MITKNNILIDSPVSSETSNVPIHNEKRDENFFNQFVTTAAHFTNWGMKTTISGIESFVTGQLNGINAIAELGTKVLGVSVMESTYTVESQLGTIEKNYSKKSSAVLNSLTDTLKKPIAYLILDVISEKGAPLPLLNWSKKSLENVVQANLLSMFFNLLQKSTLSLDIEVIDEANISEEFDEEFDEEFELNSSQLEDSDSSIEEEMDLFEEQFMPISPKFANEKRVERNIFEHLQNACANIFAPFRKEYFLINKLIKDMQFDVIKAELEISFLDRVFCPSEMLAKQALFIDKFGHESELDEMRLNALILLNTNDAEAISLCRKEAQNRLEQSQLSLKSLVESKKEFIKNEIAPQFFKVLLPKGLASLHDPYVTFSPLQSFVGWCVDAEKIFAENFEKFFAFLLLDDVAEQEAELNKNSQAPLLREGINCLSHDLLDLVGDKFDYSQPVKQDFKEFFTPYLNYIFTRVVNNNRQLDKSAFVHMMDLITNTKPNYATQAELDDPENAIQAKLQALYPEENVAISYAKFIEKLSLKAENSEEQNQAILKKGLQKLYRKENSLIARQLVGEIFSLLQLDNLENVGIPAPFAKFVNKTLQNYLAKYVNNYLLALKVDLKQLRVEHVENDRIADTDLKMSTLFPAIPAIFHYQLNHQLDVNVRTENEFSKIVNILTRTLGNQTKKWGESWSLFNFLSILFENGDLNQLTEDAVALISTDSDVVSAADRESALAFKTSAVHLLNPLLIHLILQAITPVLEKEKNGGIAFDQTLLLSILPSLSDHLKALNKPNPHRLNHRIVESSVRTQAFYKSSTNRLLDFFLPNKIESLQELFPNLENKDLEKTYELLNSEMPNLLVEAKNFLFDRTFFRDVLIEIYKTCIEFFNKTDGANDGEPAVLTPAEIELQARMEAEFKELFYQAALLTDLPVTKLLKVLSYLPGSQKITSVVMHSIGNAIQKQLNGSLVAEITEKGLKSQIYKLKPDRSTTSREKNQQLKELEKEFVKSLYSYTKRMINESTDKFLSKLDYPVIKQIKDITVAVTRFMIFKVLGGLIHLVGLDKKIVKKTQHILRRNREKLQNNLADSRKHETALQEMIQAGIQVLERDWRTESVIVN